MQNSITMKGTNTGLGVNVKGVVSSTQASSITSDGKIIVDGGVTSNGTLRYQVKVLPFTIMVWFKVMYLRR